MSISAKSAAIAAALCLGGSSAIAGTYANVETNAGWSGNDYVGAVTDLHIGYEGEFGESSSYYVQGGPAIVSVDGEENETEFSGKVGVGIGLTDSLGAYGELSALSTEQSFDDLNVGGKLGVKYNF